MKKFILIIGISLFLLITGIFFYINLSFHKNIPILAYHDVLENPINETDISIKNFEEQMKFLYKHHYKTLSLDELYNWKNGEEITGKKVVLTFDDGNESFYTKVVPILEKYHFKATVFVIQSSINSPGYLTTEQIRSLKNENENIDVQSHSYNLHMESLAKSDSYTIYNDDMQLNATENYNYYAYPFGIANDSYIKALENNHYKLAFLYSPSKWTNKDQNSYMLTRVPIYKSNSLLKFKLKVLLKI